MASNLVDTISLKVISEAGKVKGQQVTKIHGDSFLESHILSLSDKQEETEPFYVLDLGVFQRLMDKWNQSFPNVKPFYAVKCNNEPALLIALATLGASFDCASKAEIEAILDLGISPDRILYANPFKTVSHLKFAARVGVNLTTFDAKEEIDKIKKWHPQSELLLRIDVTGDESSSSSLKSKYGAFAEEMMPLLQYARKAGLKVLGVSFHVGFRSLDEQSYRKAISAARSAFDAASQLKIPMDILNIGGGFKANPSFHDLATSINDLIHEYFPDKKSLKVIAEPGRFFVESAFTMATNVIGKRARSGDQIQYWIDDGIHGSFNTTVHDNSSMNFKPLLRNGDGEVLLKTPSILFGPSCNPSDIVVSECKLPELQIDDLIVFYNMGAYTTCLGSNFNGFNRSNLPTYLVYSSSK